jgi:membrane associated rhomboid family serine protease
MGYGFGIVGLSLIAINCIVSYFGLTNSTIIDKYCFEVDAILRKKDFKRLITSGFLHVSWMHLIFNMFSLYFFSSLLEAKVGPWLFLLIYMSSLIGGNLLALFIHRHHGHYSAIGASGAVSGIIFSSIALFPDLKISLFIIMLPSWVFGLVYVLLTMYGIRSKKTNIGHEAHLGGALAGMFIAICFYPQSIKENYLPILVVAIPSIIFIILIALKPGVLTLGTPKKTLQSYTIDDMYNEQKVNREKMIDGILEKIHKKGIGSLTEKEKKLLNEYSSKK